MQNDTDALLALTLLERYHVAAQAIKRLREGVENPATVESYRVIATGIFNHLYVLLRAGMISPQMFALVLSPRAAALWLEYVAPLDAEIRLAAGARSTRKAAPLGTLPIETFYQRFAATGEITFTEKEDPACALSHS